MFDIITKRIVSLMAAAVMAMSNITSVCPEGEMPPAMTEQTTSAETTAETTETTTGETSAETTAEETAPAETTTPAGEPDLTHQSFALYPDEESSKKTVTLEGLMPEGAEVDAVDVSADYEGVAAYDITITAGESAYQPGEENPIKVEITDPVITENITLWHIRDDGEREQIFDFTVEEGKVTFFATGFSVYEIVNAPEHKDLVITPVMAETLDDLVNEDASKGFYLFIKGKGYASNNINNNGAFIMQNYSSPTDVAANSSKLKWYLEQEDSQYYLSTDTTNGKKYVKKESNSGNKIQLVDKAQATSFTIDNQGEVSVSGDNIGEAIAVEPEYAFHLKQNGNNTNYLQYSNGGSGLRFFGNKPSKDNELCNYRLVFYYASSFNLPDDPYNLDGKTYGLMNHNGGTVGNALMADPDNYYTQLFQIITRENQTSTNTNVLYVLENADITMWTFESVEEDLYYISTIVGGVTKYLHIDETEGITLTDAAEKQKIKVTPKNSTNSDESGLIQLSVDGYAISFEGADNNSKFKVAIASSTDTNQYLAFVKKSTIEPAEVITYSANKVSVCEPDDGDSVIVYTRIWNSTQNAYDFYAINYDGTLCSCYERGDNIMWIGQRVNTFLWKLTVYPDDNDPTKESYYYELYNPYSKKYIAPQFFDGDGNPDQILSDSKVGINMPGRRDGEYYSKILAWDDAEYTYAGLTDESGTLKIERRDKAGTFYFASMALSASTLTEVDTVDNTLHGITMKMVDFPNRETMSNFLGDDQGGAVKTTRDGLLSTKLGDDGYPTTAFSNTTMTNSSRFVSDAYVSGRSLGVLYSGKNDDDTDLNIKGTYQGATNVNHLFIQSTYDATGYFEFDSCQNTATLRTEGGSDGTNFKVYKELATDNQAGITHQHGQFYPYNYILPGDYSTGNPNNYYNALGEQLPNIDPRYNEPLHLLYPTGTPNCYNGMELEASFIQTPDGKDDWDHPIIFEFTGDDDFWFYVDGELVIDLGGIHSALAANVNFATGKVVVNGTETTLRDIFIRHYIDREGLSQTDAETRAGTLFKQKDETVSIGGVEKSVYVFNDYSQHTMKIFYMERGAGASNLHMRFNLSSVTPGDVMLTKTLTNMGALEEELDTELLQYPYQIWYKYNQGTDGNQVIEKRLTKTTANFDISYKNSSVNIKNHYAASYTIPDTSITIEDVFFINPNRTVVIHFPENTIEYKIVECGVHQDVYDDVSLNDQNLTKVECDPSNEKYYNYETAWQAASAKPNVVYVNHIKSNPVGMQKLYIKKVLEDSAGNQLSYDDNDDITTFSFRLYLTNGTSSELNLADMYDYHVINSMGEYCTWNRSTQKFESLKKTVYSSLSDDEKYAATFETSLNGSISKIPAGYSVVVPNLPIGSLFKVEERDYEIPLGYELVGYADEKNNENDTYHHRSPTSANEGRVILGSDPKMDISNQRGWGIEATKTWSDSPFIISYDPVYVAVYAGSALVAGTGRKITDSSPYVRYYFDSLLMGKAFKDYQVYEVILKENPTYDADGNPTDASIEDKRTNGTLFEVGAVHKANPDESYNYSYKVEYDGMYVDAEHVNIINSATGEIDVNGNTMSESITNTRTNGVEIFLYDMVDYGNETKSHPLKNGVFTLTQGGVDMGSFTSDSNGKITILYSNTGTFQSKAVYVLTQTAVPSTYIKAPFSIAFTVDETNKTVTYYQNGTDNVSPGKWADGALQSGTNEIIAKINIYNKQVELKAIKVDSHNSNKCLSGATFALYRGVNGIGGLGKDNTPFYYNSIDYSNLVTDANGVIPHIDMNLPADTYFLTEKIAPSNYMKLTQDIQFTIHENGSVTLDSSGQGETLPTPDDTTNKYSYQISIPNTSLSSDYYFDIEKIIFVDRYIHDSDMEQMFLFKVERFEPGTTDFSDPKETFYVSMNCNNDITNTYEYPFVSQNGGNGKTFDSTNKKVKFAASGYEFPAAIWNGRKTMQVKKEGIYRISEVTSWSNTDYDFWTSSNIYKGYGDGRQEGVAKIADGFKDSQSTGDNILPSGDENCVYIDVSKLKANLFAGETATIDDKEVYRPTASFTNSETEYAYLSSQAWADNTINPKTGS